MRGLFPLLFLFGSAAVAQVIPVTSSPVPIVDSNGKSIGNAIGSTAWFYPETIFDLGDGRVVLLDVRPTYFTVADTIGISTPWSSVFFSSMDCSGTPYAVPKSGRFLSSAFVDLRTLASGHQILYAEPANQASVTLTPRSALSIDAAEGTACSGPIQNSKVMSVVPLTQIVDLGAKFKPPYWLVSLAPPTFSPPPALNYAIAAPVSLVGKTAGATIYYTTDGTTPTTASEKYTGPIEVEMNTVINAIVVAEGSYTQSPVATGVYGILTAKPAFSPVGGKYATAQQVKLSDLTTGAVIYYTTDGSAPTTKSKIYASEITVSKTTTINAMAVANGFAPSPVTTATYTIGP